MALYIELLIIIVILLEIIVLFALVQATKYFALWRYKPENDKGRLGEERRRNRTAYEETGFIGGQRESAQPDILQEGGSDSSGKDSKSPRGFFARRRRK